MKTIASIAIMFLWAGQATAHEGGVDMRGVVVTAGADHIALRTAEGKEQHFAVTQRTRVTIGSAAAKIADVRPGVRAVVHARKDGERLEAVSVRAAPAKAPQPAPPRGK